MSFCRASFLLHFCNKFIIVSGLAIISLRKGELLGFLNVSLLYVFVCVYLCSVLMYLLRDVIDIGLL